MRHPWAYVPPLCGTGISGGHCSWLLPLLLGDEGYDWFLTFGRGLIKLMICWCTRLLVLLQLLLPVLLLLALAACTRAALETTALTCCCTSAPAGTPRAYPMPQAGVDVHGTQDSASRYAFGAAGYAQVPPRYPQEPLRTHWMQLHTPCASPLGHA